MGSGSHCTRSQILNHSRRPNSSERDLVGHRLFRETAYLSVGPVKWLSFAEFDATQAEDVFRGGERRFTFFGMNVR